MSFPSLTPIRDVSSALQPLLARPAAYDPHFDQLIEVRCGTDTDPRRLMTRWQLFLVGCGIQPDAYDVETRCYRPFQP